VPWSGVQKARNSPVEGQKGAFFAQKEHFFHPKISSFLQNKLSAILYLQSLTGFGRIILTSFLHSASLDPT
jgi:hypothetical protein